MSYSGSGVRGHDGTRKASWGGDNRSREHWGRSDVQDPEEERQSGATDDGGDRPLRRHRQGQREGIKTTIEGIGPILEDDDIKIVFDATGAKPHLKHAPLLKQAGKVAIDLTPAAVGPYTVPAVNLKDLYEAPNLNMVTCAGQATVPIVYAVAQAVGARYAEIVACIASKSAGPGTRQNIDEFTQTTAKALSPSAGRGRQGHHHPESGGTAADDDRYRLRRG